MVVLKRRNGRGAKRGRKVDALQRARQGIQTGKLVLWPRSPETPTPSGVPTSPVTSWNRMLATFGIDVRLFASPASGWSLTLSSEQVSQSSPR